MQTQIKQRQVNILLGYDGSSHAQASVEWINSLPLASQSRVTALGVLPPRESSNHALLEASLVKAMEAFTGRNLQVTTEVTVGDPAETLIQHAEQLDLDLIVVGAKGLRATLGILLGGVAQQIVEYASLPVLVVRAPFKQIQRVLLLIDGSRCSQVAVDYLAGQVNEDGIHLGDQFPLPLNAEVFVLHVLPPAPSPDMIARNWPIGPELLPNPAFDMKYEENWLEEEKAAGEKLLADTVEHLQMAGIKTNGVLLRGDAATEIIDYAKVNQINLIIAGSRGLSPMRGWWLGSVSRKLVHYAGCSVLIVKGLPHCAGTPQIENLN